MVYSDIVVSSTSTRPMLDALMDAGYSLRDAAAALHLSATDLLDASESAAQPLAALDGFSRQVAELQVLDSRMQALKALVKVCNDATDLEKKRLAAQAILRFDPFRHAPPSGELSPRPRQRRAVTEGAPSASSPTGSPRHGNFESNGTVRANTAPAAPGGAPARQHDRVPRLPAVAGLDRPLPSPTSPPRSPAGKSQIRRGGPCDESSIPAPPPIPASPAELRPPSAPCPPLAHSPAHLLTCSPAQVSAAALAAAAGHAISVYALIPQSARAPPLRAAA